MSKDILQKNINAQMEKLFPGASIEPKGEGCNKQQKKYAVFSKGQTEIRFKRVDGNFSWIKRAQPFTKQELKIIQDIIQIAEEYSVLDVNTQIYLNANSSLSRVVAKSLVTKNSELEFEAFLSQIINTLEIWSAQTYEGVRISTSLGVDSNSAFEANCNRLNINDYDGFVKEDFAKVLCNGFDTIVEFSKDKVFLGYTTLNNNGGSGSVPYRYSSFAVYTSGAEQEENKYAFILNRNGEILIFHEGKLLFAKRRGEWRLFTHDSVLKQLAFGSRKTVPELQNAIYESVLDVSFARCGGCIGFIQKSTLAALRRKNIIKKEDNWLESASNNSIKTKALRKLIGTTKFHELDRRIRQEILGIDGSTIIDYEGNILSVGAILNMSQEETISAGGGARLAAAKSLREFGYSVKISADGEIRAFGKSNKEFRFG